VMPCTAKKFEITRPELATTGAPDVDAVLTTRELARMFKEAGIELPTLPSSDFDQPLGESTGAAVIFGTTGGVMEAALRTVYEKVTGKALPQVEFTQVRGLEGIREATVDLAGTQVRLAVAHGLSNAKALLERIKNGDENYTFVEIMACPGGCIGGGGGPRPTDQERRLKRAEALYNLDRELPLRKSHENPAVEALYSELGEPGGEVAHRLLHTHYHSRTGCQCQD
jgi:NADP-reducing hydrogenase subunit HndD